MGIFFKGIVKASNYAVIYIYFLCSMQRYSLKLPLYAILLAS